MLLTTILAFLAPVMPAALRPDHQPDISVSPAPKPGSIDHLIAFLEGQPHTKEYIWADAQVCLFSQWGDTFKSWHETGYRAAKNATKRWGFHEEAAEIVIAMGLPFGPFHSKKFHYGRTMGDALRRARSYKEHMAA